MTFAVERFASDIEDAWEDFHFGVTDSDYDPGNDIAAIFMPYFLYRWRDPIEADIGDTWQPGTIATSFLEEKGAP